MDVLQHKKYFLLVTSFFWIVFGIGITLLRVGYFPLDIFETFGAILGFLFVGLLSGFLLFKQLHHSLRRFHKKFFLFSYISSLPLMYLLALGGTLTLEILPILSLPKILTFLILIPLAMGIWGTIGYIIVITTFISLTTFIIKIKDRIMQK